MNIITKRITNISALQYIQLLRFLVLLLIGVVFTRFYSKSEIGEYETLLFVASAVSFFWLQGILQTFLSVIDSQANEKKSNLYFNVFILLLFFNVLTIAFLFVFKGSIEKHLINSQPIPYFSLLMLFMFFSTPSFLIEYVYLVKNKAKAIFLYGTISYGLQFLFLSMPALLGYSVEFALIGLVVVSVGRFVFLVSVLYRFSEFKISFPFIKKHLKLSYSIIISTLLSGSGQYVDGIIITKLFDTADFAVFRYGAREIPLIIIMSNAFSNAMIPEFVNRTYNDALVKLKQNSLKLMHLLFPVALVLLIVSNLFFPFFFTPNFSVSAKIFNIYSLLIICRLIFPETILIGRRNTTLFLPVALIEITVNVTLSLFFAQKMGILGIAYATVVANLIERILLIGILHFKFHTPVNKYVPLNWFTFYSIAFVIVYWLVDFVFFKI